MIECVFQYALNATSDWAHPDLCVCVWGGGGGARSVEYFDIITKRNFIKKYGTLAVIL
jgi:hypothetical protein